MNKLTAERRIPNPFVSPAGAHRDFDTAPIAQLIMGEPEHVWFVMVSMGEEEACLCYFVDVLQRDGA